jgi:hypothetical protein
LNFKIEKFKNFHGCELLFGTYDYLGEYFYKKNTKTPSGYLYDIYKDLAKEFNFKLKLMDYYEYNKKRFEPIQIIILNNCFPPSITFRTFSKIHISQPYFSASELLAVSQGEEISGYEKLKFPFDNDTWILIFFFFATAYLVIFIINFASIKIRNLVFGEYVNSPTFNVLAHFFGLGQNHLPRRSFPRFLVMSFIIYSLIIRTAWQGKIFEFMNKEIRKPEVTSVDEAIEKDYEFHMWHCTKCKNDGKDVKWCNKNCGMDER